MLIETGQEYNLFSKETEIHKLDLKILNILSIAHNLDLFNRFFNKKGKSSYLNCN